MQKSLYILIVLILSTLAPAKAQSFFSSTEYGVSVGGSQYFGDLNDNHGFRYIRPAGGMFVRFHMNPYIGIRASAAYTKVGYDDKFTDNPYNQARNLDFRSDIIEGSVQAEFNFFRFYTGELKSRFTPYLTGGIGAFYYNPYTTYQGTRYYLRPLGTEGQNAGFDDRKYGKVSICFPVGAGVKYWVLPGVNVGFEVANRLTLTDYMDDVSTTYVGEQYFPSDPMVPNPANVLQDRSASVNGQRLGRAGKQRGNSASKDQYLMFMFNLSFQLKTYKCPSYMKEGYYMY